MSSFLKDVVDDLYKKSYNFSELIFILPSKRAGNFLKNEFSKQLEKPMFSPKIVSIEVFVEELSDLKAINNTELLFEFYNTYCKLTKKEDIETFESFSKWAQIILKDFNEIDRYLIPQEQVFSYLGAIKTIESDHWSLDENASDFVKRYISFWNRLNNYYKHFTDSLKGNKLAYQGLIYREAVENLESYISSNSKKHHVFLGFNALNTSEEIIIQELLENNMASIYWDIDKHFSETLNHNAGHFIKRHLSNWNYFKNNDLKWVSNYYSKKKKISVVGAPKQIGQAKYVGELINQLNKTSESLKNTAIILGDESLLIPMLNALPTSVGRVNITMGFPLKHIPLASWFEKIFLLHKHSSVKFYHKDLIAIISHASIASLLNKNGNSSSFVTQTIATQNISYLSKDDLLDIIPENEEVINLIFSDCKNNPLLLLNRCVKLILMLKKQLDENKEKNTLELEYLYRFNELFNQLDSLNKKYNHIKDISALFSVYKELLSGESLDFKGEPLHGLQLMGMLESRVLDFETVIITSVNEGVLPSGKTYGSFIPFDVKAENKLPTYKEKDAVYAYHFFRLIQRAKNVYIIYNTENDALLGGEKSRFITQLEVEGIHDIDHKIIVPNVPAYTKKLLHITKTESVVKTLEEIAKKGFSPSSLTNYIRNPIDFYYQKVLKIKEYNNVEETVAANTLGTIIHNTLEDFYTPLIGELLSVEKLKFLKTKIDERIRFHFKDQYKQGDISKGKNLIVFEIAKRYVSNFIDMEVRDLKQGNTIKILAVEAENKFILNIPDLYFPIRLKGKVDRVDEYNGTVRIIDYKTGSVAPNHVEIVNWEDITTDYTKYSKSFQLLTYALTMQKEPWFRFPVEAGILSFKNLNKGVLKFAKKDSSRSRTKNTLITQDTLESFEKELQKLILEIFNPEVDFIEKEV